MGPADGAVAPRPAARRIGRGKEGARPQACPLYLLGPTRALPRAGGLLPRVPADRDGEAQRGDEVVLELVAAAEVAVVHVVLEIQPDRGVVALAETEPEAGAHVGTEIGAALVIVERILAPGDQGRAARDVEPDAVRGRAQGQHQSSGRDEHVGVGLVDGRARDLGRRVAAYRLEAEVPGAPEGEARAADDADVAAQRVVQV